MAVPAGARHSPEPGVFYLNLAINGIVEGLLIGLAAMALNLVFAVGRFPNAATGDFLTVGAYTGFGAQQAGGSIWLQGVAAIGACMAVSVLCYLAVFRRLLGRAMVAAMLASIGVGFFLRSMLSLGFGHDPQIFPMQAMTAVTVFGLRLRTSDLWLAGIALGCAVLVLAVLHFTPIGRQMRAIADNAVLAQASGIRSGRVMLCLWTMVGAVSGLAGLVLGMRTTVSPEMGWGMLLPAFAAAVLGGVGSPAGAVLAGILVGVLQELSTPWLGFSYKIALSFVALALVLLLRPQGLFGRAETVR
ncbi:MAG: branched-chain amino acid ABC transporter permease [Rhodospirillales bacterium]|nr:branched-chain amino acid ABC transporter permease [Rhodospirillales bacterium]